MKINEIVNKAGFKMGFDKKKSILDGAYELRAMPGRFIHVPGKFVIDTDQFRIEAHKGKRLAGWVNFEQVDNALEALDLFVTKDYRRQGIASEMYKFAEELGNTI